MPELLERLSSALANRYAVQSEIGRGGMAVVFLAEDLKHGRKVAIKVLLPELAASVGGERFLREIEIAARLEHAHILSLIDSGEADGLFYYVMPYVDGESLRDRLAREKQLPIEDAIRIAREVANGLGYAHRQGVVHRDIKPANVLLSEGHSLIADFGVARAMGIEGQGLTSTGLAVGTPAYMSPEQASSADDVDARSDLYALGCMLYEMLAGEPPLTGPTPQATAMLRLTETATALPLLRETVPGGLDQVVSRALAKSPVDRYGTAEELAEALAAPVVWEEARPKRQVGRRVLAVGTLTIAAVAAAWMITNGRSTTRQAEQLRAGRDLGERSVAVFPFANNTGADSLDGLRTVLPSMLTTGLKQVETVRVVSVERVLDILRQVAGEHIGQVPEDLVLTVGSASGARAMIDGSLVKLGDDFRLDARLIDLADGTVISAEQARGPNVFTLVEELTQRLLIGVIGEATAPFELTPVSRLTTPNIEAYREYSEGLLAARRQLRQAASEHFQRAVALDSTFALAWMRLGYMDMYNAELATSYFERARRFSADAPEKDRLLIQAYLANVSGRHGESADLLEELIARFPQETEPRYLLGYFFSDQGRVEEARHVWEELLEVDPHDAVTVVSLAYLTEGAGDEEAADSLSLRFIELEPDQANPYDTRGQILETFGHDEDARTMYREAIRRDPSFTPSYEHLATSYVRAGDAAAARAALEPFLTTVGQEDAYVIRRVMADTYGAEGRYLSALDAYLDLDGQAPNPLQGSLNLRDIGLLATETGKYEVAEEAYRMLYQRGHLRLVTQIGWLSALGRQQRFDEMSRLRDTVAADLEMVSDLDLKNTQALLRLADGFIAWYRLGDAEETVRLFEEGRLLGDVRTARLPGHYQDEEVRALIDVGRAADALPILQELESFGQGNIRPIITHIAWYQRGRAYEALGERERALESYERLLATVGEGYREVLAFQDTQDRIDRLRGDG